MLYVVGSVVVVVVLFVLALVSALRYAQQSAERSATGYAVGWSGVARNTDRRYLSLQPLRSVKAWSISIFWSLASDLPLYAVLFNLESGLMPGWLVATLLILALIWFLGMVAVMMWRICLDPSSMMRASKARQAPSSNPAIRREG